MMYKKAEALFWTAKEMDISNDIQDWNNWVNNKCHFAKGTVDVQENLGFVLDHQRDGPSRVGTTSSTTSVVSLKVQLMYKKGEASFWTTKEMDGPSRVGTTGSMTSVVLLKVQSMYKKGKVLFWTAEEMDLSKDYPGQGCSQVRITHTIKTIPCTMHKAHAIFQRKRPCFKNLVVALCSSIFSVMRYVACQIGLAYY